jgi:hypothetical protein
LSLICFISILCRNEETKDGGLLLVVDDEETKVGGLDSDTESEIEIYATPHPLSPPTTKYNDFHNLGGEKKLRCVLLQFFPASVTRRWGDKYRKEIVGNQPRAQVTAS